MPFRDIAEPEDLEMLQTAFDLHCTENGITSETERENVAFALLSLFGNGVTGLEDLLSALERKLAR